jgi:5'-3' exonuclease
MGVSKAFEFLKNCPDIKKVDPQKEGPCEIDGSAVSYWRFKTSEGRLLLKELKKMAKDNVTLGTPAPRLAHWHQESWSFPSLEAEATHQTSSSTEQHFSDSNALSSSSHLSADVHHELNKARDAVWPLLAHVLNKMFEKFYKKSDDFIHYDGQPTTQKAFAHEKRRQATKKQYIKLSEYFLIAETRLSQMESNPKLSNRQVSRFKSFLSKILFPCWIRARNPSHRATRAVANELRESHGWKAHQCAGQFDICVAKKAQNNSNLTVVSTDSDLLFLGAGQLFRLQTKGTHFYCYPVKKIISYCGLKTPEEWVAAAVVSHNDYDPSVGKTSFSSAIKEIIDIRNDQVSKKIKCYSADKLVKELCKKKKVDYSTVKESLDSFVKFVETPTDCYIQDDDLVDESIRRIIYRVQALALRYE